MQPAYDDLPIRCPRLGHELTFAYCRREAGDLPCHRTIRCWQARFPVEDHLQAMLTEAQWALFLQRAPEDKVASLIGLIAQAKSRAAKKS